MTGFSALLLGVGLGIRHAADADHVVVVSALLQREQGTARAARVAALWGAGHAASCLSIGLVIVLVGLRAPPELEAAAELLVAAMLLGLGAMHTASSLSTRMDRPDSLQGSSCARPLLIGMVHGVAGSAGSAIMATTAMGSRLWAVAYLLLFGVGSMVGMVLLTVVLSWSLQWTGRSRGSPRTCVRALPGLLSLGLGLVLIFKVLGG